MKEYKFAVSLCNGWCDGTITVKAKDREDAYDKAMDLIGNKLMKAFPDLDIPYNVELDENEELEDDQTDEVITAVDKALWDYASDNVDVVRDEETDMLHVMYHSDNNSFAIFDDVAHADFVNMSRLNIELSKRNIGYCG